MSLYCLMLTIFHHYRFGSIIVGAVRSKISAKKVEGGGMNASSKSKRRTRGSFSFLGGMQVNVPIC